MTLDFDTSVSDNSATLPWIQTLSILRISDWVESRSSRPTANGQEQPFRLMAGPLKWPHC